jgi:hypothetical protein
MDEKFEGERGIWNPQVRMMYHERIWLLFQFLSLWIRLSRINKEMIFPDAMKLKMPLIFLDGELWY